MKILSIDCSAVPCSAAIIDNGKITASAFSNVKLTHSQTLLPMVEGILKNSKTSIDEIEGFAISNGPGSFTGVRIGISAVKGLAMPNNIPCVAVSTLESMAENVINTDCTVCAVMDARCGQVYNANFKIENGEIARLCPDRAIMCEELKDEIKKYSQTVDGCVIIIGDGAEMFYEYVKDFDNIKLADINHRFQNAVSVGLLAEKSFNCGNFVSASALLPMYLRLPQAERELKLKKELKK